MKSALACSLILVVAACQPLGPSAPSAGGQPAALSAAPQKRLPIRHVVIIVQENRTLDNLFHGFRGADTAQYGVNTNGQRVPLRPQPLAAPLFLTHDHTEFKTEYGNGKMDGFNLARTWCKRYTPPSQCPAPDIAAYSYVPKADVLPYWSMAERYALADEMFQSNQGPSFPAHQYVVSGTSAISNTSLLKAASNPSKEGNGGGCGAPQGDFVLLIDQYGNENQRARPCFDRTSLMKLANEAGLTWRYYGYTTGPSIWNAPNAVKPIWLDPLYKRSDLRPPSRVLLDISHGFLADVTWVTPTRLESDHPGGNDGSGPSWVASVVDAIGESAFWDSTAIFVTWDDWGGWYDHVAPHIYNSYELGFRVPLIVISPYAKRAYVSHTQHEFGSILKFTEKIFDLPSLGTTDARADDLFDCFDFSSRPHPFDPIKAPYGASYFLRETLSPENPDDD